MSPAADTWREKAACLEVDTELFFAAMWPDDLTQGDPEAARAVCRRCPVRRECKADQMGEPFGIRFDTDPTERGYRVSANHAPTMSTWARQSIRDTLEQNPERGFTAPDLQKRLRLPNVGAISVELKKLADQGILTRTIRVPGDSARLRTYQWKATP